MATEALKDLSSIAAFKGCLTRRDIRENLSKPDLSEDQIIEINRNLRNIKAKIEKCPASYHGRVDFAYLTINTEAVNGIDTLSLEIDLNQLAFILCFIYVSHQCCKKEDLLQYNKITESDLDALKKQHFIEIYKDKVYWGVRSRLYWTHDDIVNCINAVLQKDLTEPIKKAGKVNDSPGISLALE